MLLPLALAVADLISIKPALATHPVAGDPDDIAIWRDSSAPERSLIVGTDKEKGLYTFNLKGEVLSFLDDVDHPNNVDVEYGLNAPNGSFDIAVATERGKKRLRIYRIDNGRLTDVTGKTEVFHGEVGPASECMGISLFKRPADGKVFAFVSRKEPGPTGYVWQYRLDVDSFGKVNLTKVREIGIDIRTEVESIAVDDQAGFVYFAEETGGVYKFAADHEGVRAQVQLAKFGTTGFLGEREGIGIAAAADGSGFVYCSDQIKEASRIVVFRREGSASNRHDHSEVVAILSTGADETDGLEVDTRSYPGFPEGILICMNSKAKNFLMYPLPRLGGEPSLN